MKEKIKAIGYLLQVFGGFVIALISGFGLF